MIAILEGPDGAGKTTLAQVLIKYYDATYAHEGLPPAGVSTLVHYGNIIQRAREAGGSWVFDRLALGERVYGPIFRKRDSLGRDGARLFRRVARAAGAVEVLCLPPWSVVRKHWLEKRSDMNKSEGTLRLVYDAYAEMGNDGKQIIYDWTRPGAESFLVERLLAVEQRVLPTPYIGHPRAQHLIVGDRGSEPKSLTGNLAFFGETNSSGWLDRMLRAAGYEEHELMFVNAWQWNREGTAVTPTPLVVPNHGMSVIALGNSASDVLRNQGIQHQQLPHPQYWKRFFSKDEASYVERLRACRIE